MIFLGDDVKGLWSSDKKYKKQKDEKCKNTKWQKIQKNKKKIKTIFMGTKGWCRGYVKCRQRRKEEKIQQKKYKNTKEDNIHGGNKGLV